MSNTTLSGFDGGQAVSPAIQTAIRLIKELNSRGIQIEPRAFKVTRMEPEALKFNLDVAKIPYIEMKSKDTILVAKEDIQKCWQFETRNQTKGNFLQEYNSKELEQIVKKNPHIRDKSIVSIKNMNPAEAGLFLRKCNRIKKGMLLETEKTSDGAVNVNIPAGLLSHNEKEKMVDAYVQTQIEISGINSASKTRSHRYISIQTYWNSVTERRMVNSLTEMLKNKLDTVGSAIDDFGPYLKSLKMQLGYVMESFQKNKEPTGFDATLLEKTMRTYHSFPDNTYKYTVLYLKKQQITSKQAMASSVNLTPDHTKPIQREVI